MPVAAWLFLLLIPLIAFYFLKLKRPRVTIPSLVLWQQVLNDQRVNSPFQKFKRNVLLLLQVLLLVALVIAAMQPFLLGDRAREKHIPVLIDTSASMGAIAIEGSRSRLDAAKEQISEMVDNMLPDQKICLISVSDTARQETVFTGNKRILKEALESLEIDDVASNIEDGLRMAQAVRRSDAFDTLVFYSDGNFPQQAYLDLQFDIDFRKLDTGGPNLGITASSARRADAESWDVFVELRSSDKEPATATLSITTGEGADSLLLASKIVTVRAGTPQRLVFRIAGRNSELLQLELTPETFDSLPADNVAFLRLRQNRPLDVYAPKSLSSVRHALRTLPHVAAYPSDDATSEPKTFDLVISDRESDVEIPASVSCIFGSIPSDLRDLITLQKEASEIVDWKRDSPLFEHTNLREVILLDKPVAIPGTDGTLVGERGYRILVEGESGPIMLEKEDSAGRSIRALFDPERSTLPFRVAFPIFITNLVNETLLATGLAESKASATGVLETVTIAPEGRATITMPDGQRQKQTANAEGTLSGIVASNAGKYRVQSDGAEVIVGASLVSSAESSLEAVETIEFNELAVTASSGESITADKPLWRYFATAALILLVVEWWYFHKRPYSQGRGTPPKYAA